MNNIMIFNDFLVDLNLFLLFGWIFVTAGFSNVLEANTDGGYWLWTG